MLGAAGNITRGGFGNVSYHLKNIFETNELDHGATVQIIRTVQLEVGRSVKIVLAEGPLVANLATTQRQQNPTIAKSAQVEGPQHPTIADFAMIELVTNCDNSGRWELTLVASMKEAA